MYKTLALLMVAFIVVACAQNDHTGGNCGTGVVNDINDMGSTCGGLDTEACRGAIQSVLNKYPGISCKARNLRTDDEVTITEDYLKSLLPPTESPAEIPEERLEHKNGNACGSIVIEDFNKNISHPCQLIIKPDLSTDIKLYEGCRDGVERFLKKYPGVYCKYSTGTETKYMSEENLLKLKKIIEDAIEQIEKKNPKKVA